jgi:hypothetical protein
LASTRRAASDSALAASDSALAASDSALAASDSALAANNSALAANNELELFTKKRLIHIYTIEPRNGLKISVFSCAYVHKPYLKNNIRNFIT